MLFLALLGLDGFARFVGQALDVVQRQMQTLRLFGDHGARFAVQLPPLKGMQQLGFEVFAVNAQLVGEGRGQQASGNGKNADADQSQHHGEGAAHGRDGRNVAITHRGQRDHRPVDRLRNVFKLVGLGLVLEQIAQAGGEHHQQQHDKHRG